MDEYITKPFEPDLLLARINFVLQRRAKYAEMVKVDSLTGLLNRYNVEKEIAMELEKLKRYKGNYSWRWRRITNYSRLLYFYNNWNYWINFYNKNSEVKKK